MNTEEQRRAGAVVSARIAELNTTPADIARKAGLDPTTVRAIMRGTRWPQNRTRERLTAALGWSDGEIARRAIDGSPLDQVPTVELARVLLERVRESA